MGALTARCEDLQRSFESIKELIQPGGEEDAGTGIGEIISCTSERIRGYRYGIDAVRFAMLRATGLELEPVVKLAKPAEIVPYDQLPDF